MVNADTVLNIPPDHPAFAGHFPGRPIVPGVLLLDQALLLAEQRMGRPLHGWTVTQAKFLGPSGPGDRLVFELRDAPKGALVFAIRCDGRDIASGQLAPSAA